MLALLALVPIGCAARGNVEMLESELRRQEQTQQELAEELKSARAELRVARTDADNLRAQLSQRGQTSLVSEQADVLYKAEAIRFNTMLTSGANRDGQPGDDGLNILLQPVDAQGDLVKLAGAIELDLLDLNRDGESQRIGRWQFTAEEVRDRWHRGFLSAGYLFQLDWQTVPVSSELTLHARLASPDGRTFSATTQVKVDPAGAPGQHVAAASAADKRRGSGVVHAGHTERPAPRKPVEKSIPKPARKLRQKPATRKQPVTEELEELPLQTSDNFTEETIPRLR